MVSIPEKKLPPLDAACASIAPDDPKCACVNNEIFKHDSSWATAGIGKKANNPCNMRVPSTWKPSVPMMVYTTANNGHFAKFETLEDGITACVELYARNYKHRSAYDLVSIWTNRGAEESYYYNVAQCY